MTPFIQEQLKVCRVCLALNVKMHNMKDFGLSEMFQNVTGISAIDKKSSRLQWICWECTARLTAAAAFREKALLSDALLHDQVHMKESDIAILKQNYSSLKSTLSLIPAFTLSDIECEHAISKSNEIDNNILREVEFEEYEHLIDIPVKTEVESDPEEDNNMRYQDRKSDAFLELTHFNDTSSGEDSEDEMTNTEVQIETNDNILTEDTRKEDPVIYDINNSFIEDDFNVEKKTKLDEIDNMVDESSREDTHSYSEAVTHFNDTSSGEDSEDEMTNTEVQIETNDNILTEDTRKEDTVINDININFIEEDFNVEKKTKLDEIDNMVDESSREEDTQSYSEAVSFSKSEQKMSSKVGTIEGTATIRNNKSLRTKIIDMKKNGVPTRVITNETGVSIDNIRSLWYRYRCDLKKQRRSTLGQESDAEQNNIDDETSKQPWTTKHSLIVNQRLQQAGLLHIIMKLPERTENMGQKMSKREALHEKLKQRIVALKERGMGVVRIAYLLNTTPNTVRRWWLRWSKEGHMNNRKSVVPRKRITTTLEDRLIVERVAQEQTIHTATLAKEFGVSTDSIRRRLKEAGFQFKQPKASIPLRSGRSHKVDEVTKQRIIAMKHSGISVTEIANQFQVTRTSVYLWWRRWCKENNIKITSDKNTSKMAEQEQSLAEDTNVEKIEKTPSVLSSQQTT